MKAETEVGMEEREIESMLESAKPESNPRARDDFHDTVKLNGKSYPVDIEKLQGELKKALRKLEDKLRVA